MLEALIEGLGLGLATGTACLASCGPIYVTYLLGERRSGAESLRVILLLNAGRFAAYAAFGALVGSLGGFVPYSVRIPVAYSGYILFSAYMVLSVIRVHKACAGCDISRLMRITGSPLLLGILTGFSICPAFLIAITGAFHSSGALSGVMLFLGFFAGTTVYMLPFSILGLLTKKRYLTTVARVAGVVVAAYFGVAGVRGLAAFISTDGAASRVPRGEGEAIFSIMSVDTIYVLGFEGDSADHGVDLIQDLRGAEVPSLVPVITDSTDWRRAVRCIPQLSAVFAPQWVDPRSGLPTLPWQDSVSAALKERRFRVFALEYEPYCSETPRIIMSFLDRYSFKCDPDSGMIFYMANPSNPSDCATCPFGP